MSTNASTPSWLEVVCRTRWSVKRWGPCHRTILGHGIMRVGWWTWFFGGYAGVKETVSYV
jgi:hypothetical protein